MYVYVRNLRVSICMCVQSKPFSTTHIPSAELDSLLTKWKKETGSLEDHIDAALLAICSTDRLRSYVLSPPKMTRLCSGIRGEWAEVRVVSCVGGYGQWSRQVNVLGNGVI